MNKRGKLLINRKFQLKTLFTVIGISGIFVLGLIAIMLVVNAKNSRMMQSAVSGLNTAINSEDKIIESFIDHEQKDASTSFIAKSGIIKNNHEVSMQEIRTYIKKLETAVNQGKYFIYAALGLFLLQCMIFFFYIINFTHRISGPIYVITRHMEDIINGQKTDFRALREKDELKDFYEKFIEMVKNLDSDRS